MSTTQKFQVYRICPHYIRSTRAFESQAHLQIIDVPSVEPQGKSQRDREIAASLAHAAVMEQFLKTTALFAVVLEDDAILEADCTWMTFDSFDYFIPFAANRMRLPPDSRIRMGSLPHSGAFAYLCSRRFAERYLPRLMRGRVADRASLEAASGLIVGSFAGNLVNHDNFCKSMISERRRREAIQRLAK